MSEVKTAFSEHDLLTFCSRYVLTFINFICPNLSQDAQKFPIALFVRTAIFKNEKKTLKQNQGIYLNIVNAMTASLRIVVSTVWTCRFVYYVEFSSDFEVNITRQYLITQ